MNSVVWRTAVAFLFLLPLAVQAGPAPVATPEKVKGALAELEKFADQTLKKTGVPGMAIAVVFQDEVVYLKGFGVRQTGKEEPVDADTVFQLASVSKPIATTVLAALVGEGVIHWDDRVIDHDGGFRLYDPWVTREVTFRDLLCHRSGLPAHAGDLLEDLGYGRAEVLHRLRYLKPGSSFRSRNDYTNFAFTEAGIAGARAAGKTWEELSADKLYRPLGMTSTSSRFADYAAAKNRALLRVGREAYRIVHSLFDQLVSRSAVLEHLGSSSVLSQPLREEAQARAQRYRQDPHLLNEMSWRVVSRPGAPKTAYQRALLQAQEACRLAPGTGGLLNTLGVAQYRAGLFQPALESLTESDKIQAVGLKGSHPADLAFLAMAHYQLGQKDQAQTVLGRLRETMQQARWAKDVEARGFLQEAESLLQATTGNANTKSP